jgi:hypothetical protein
MDKVLGLALSNPKFRTQLLDPSIDQTKLLKKYNLKFPAGSPRLDKGTLVSAFKAKLDLPLRWCVGNICGLGT